MRRRVVVTGIGCVTPSGNNPEKLWENLLAGRSGVAKTTLFDASNFPTKISAQVKDWSIAEEGEDIDIMTNEGVAAVDEAIRALRSEAPRPSFVWSDMLQRAAADHVAVQSRSGAVGHYSNNSDPGVRMRARGGGPYVSEVITYGHQTPPGVIHQLLIDDGVPGRGHRFSLLRSDLRYAGVACGPHPHYRLMCVILMSPTRDGTAPPPPQRSAP